jgi:hypothetical protein
MSPVGPAARLARLSSYLGLTPRHAGGLHWWAQSDHGLMKLSVDTPPGFASWQETLFRTQIED